MMEKPILSPSFTIEDIHKIREYNYEVTKNLCKKDKLKYYNEKGYNAQKLIEQLKTVFN